MPPAHGLASVPTPALQPFSSGQWRERNGQYGAAAAYGCSSARRNAAKMRAIPSPTLMQCPPAPVTLTKFLFARVSVFTLQASEMFIFCAIPGGHQRVRFRDCVGIFSTSSSRWSIWRLLLWEAAAARPLFAPKLPIPAHPGISALELTWN